MNNRQNHAKVGETQGALVETAVARAWLLAERLDTRSLERAAVLGTTPLAVRLPKNGIAVLFRYGVVVLFNTDPSVEAEFLAQLTPLLTDPLAKRENDFVRLRVDPGADEQVDAQGVIVVHEIGIERLQALAIVLAKSLVLSHYELRLAAVFDRIDPLASGLARRGRSIARSAALTRQIGKVLLIQHRMVGRAEVSEKPELLWEHPELERFYTRLAEEYELRERDHALDRKLDVISRTVESLLSLVQSNSNLRVEWYIVALIVVELILSIFAPSRWW